MFIRKYWLPLSVFIVAIVGIGLYLLATQPPKEPIKIYKVVEPEKPTEQPTTEAPVEDTSQGGHVHADGTWHEGPHEPVETPAAPASYFSDAELAEIPEDMLEPDIPLPADLKNLDLDRWKQWRDKYQAEWNKYIHALDPAIERLGREVKRLSAEMPPESSPDYTAALAKHNAKMLEYNRLITEKGWRIHDANDARQSASDKYSLARFGKK